MHARHGEQRASAACRACRRRGRFSPPPRRASSAAYQVRFGAFMFFFPPAGARTTGQRFQPVRTARVHVKNKTIQRLAEPPQSTLPERVTAQRRCAACKPVA